MKNNKNLFLMFVAVVVGLLFVLFIRNQQSGVLPDEMHVVEDEKPEEVKDFTSEKEVTLDIKDYKFTPPTIRIKTGTKVTWINRDVAKHNAVADDGSFKTELIGKDESASVIFDKTGTFGYFCGPHPFMRGTIIVE